ncbi:MULTISPECIES: 2-phosphosulfolactate phosphatase [Calothrix]|uniref:Probable 2-phosphosulfolactate phosphatase n=2 Tax=Calothrix TaxID=1186 RepID=A0ABR8A9B6_9CYAN|nr:MULTISPECIES: 2-phosphosulfolactate phosphatase [Calothrix]MBD2195878.1 2-phosphosulfolactate phosphatase [Calothrix parietina FACHB-288]MBD2227592.1 2-phosphosulfolactate phosphatase [Calothrix anomala FACHB-343]
MIYDQAEFDLRCEWGVQGVTQLAPISDVIIIVDVLSFSTATEIATKNGAIIYPYQWRDDSAIDYAKSVNAELAKGRFSQAGYSLSPASLTKITTGTKLVIPSPNGSTLTLLTRKTPTIAGCLRNCEAVAKFAQKYGSKIAVIPAGEKWEDGTLRPAFEDLIGVGAILSFLNGSLSPEAESALAVFQTFRNDLLGYLKKSSSGKELIAKGYELDVELAAAFNISNCVPLLTENAYINRCIL